MSVKITTFEAENVKRIKAVQIEPAEKGLTVIGGDNGQGKTSVLDSIAWALGGDRFRPSQPQRAESVIPPSIKVTLSNGLIVERNGKNSSLKVIDPSGNRGGQQLLNSFVEQLALDLPRFMSASGKEKAQVLLKIIGIGDQLYALDRKESELYNERLAVGRIADQKKATAKELPFYENCPDEPVSASELIRQQQDILAKNGENARKRARKEEIHKEIESLTEKIRTLQDRFEKVEQDYLVACESNIKEIDQLNAKIRTNAVRLAAEREAKNMSDQYDGLTAQIEDVRKQRMDLLDGAQMPLPGLSVEKGELTYRGQAWDNMSSAEQLQVATAIVRKLNPECGFVLLDKLEQMDLNTLREFSAWLEGEGLQAIATRVSTGDECSILIVDGMSVEPQKKEPTWNRGAF